MRFNKGKFNTGPFNKKGVDIIGEGVKGYSSIKFRSYSTQHPRKIIRVEETLSELKFSQVGAFGQIRKRSEGMKTSNIEMGGSITPRVVKNSGATKSNIVFDTAGLHTIKGELVLAFEIPKNEFDFGDEIFIDTDQMTLTISKKGGAHQNGIKYVQDLSVFFDLLPGVNEIEIESGRIFSEIEYEWKDRWL